MSSNDPEAQLVKYLADAHSIDEQALAQMRQAPDIAGHPKLESAFRVHLTETERHEQLMRERLEAHGASPSKFKDLVMKVGGHGFVWCARSQPDTPGKLAAHAYSYEALELASYELLLRAALRAGDEETAAAAREIREDEQAMLERIGGSFDESVEASLRDVDPDDVSAQLVKYLADARAIENQAIGLLENGPKLADDPVLGRIFEAHLAESHEQQRLVEARLEALGGSPSRLKDTAMKAGALGWAAFFGAHPDTAGKLAAFAFAFEHLEIGGYEQLKRVAERAGDAETVAVAERILGEERAAARNLSTTWDHAAEASLSG